MKLVLLPALFLVLLGACKKDDRNRVGCNMAETWTANESKITISNGVWGTVSSMEGDCMPVIDPSENRCTHCPVKRTVRIYEYTNRSQANPSGGPYSSFYSSFSTQLIRELITDRDGFFQTELPPGQYTIVTLENGKLYAHSADAQGGLNPLNVVNGKNKRDILLTYKAVF